MPIFVLKFESQPHLEKTRWPRLSSGIVCPGTGRDSDEAMGMAQTFGLIRLGNVSKGPNVQLQVLIRSTKLFQVPIKQELCYGTGSTRNEPQTKMFFIRLAPKVSSFHSLAIRCAAFLSLTRFLSTQSQSYKTQNTEKITFLYKLDSVLIGKILTYEMNAQA